MKCIVCESAAIEIFDVIDQKKYWKCSICLAKFMDKTYLPTSVEEKAHYLTHQNIINDQRYRNFLSKLATPLRTKISKGDKGLDYGCGHGPALADMLKSNGFDMDLYDPFFFPNKSIFSKTYDFISCTETVEHFFYPSIEFCKLDSLLKKHGWLGVMTCFMTSDQFFKNWYYRRDPTHVVFYCEQTFEVISKKLDWTYEIVSKDIVLLQKN